MGRETRATSARSKVWRFGLILAVVGMGGLAGFEATRELIVPLSLIALGVIALAAEGISLWSLAISSKEFVPPSGALPADGIVEIATMSAIEGIPLFPDPRWKRFVRLAERTSKDVLESTLTRTNPTLLGRIVLISIFVGRDGRSWSDSEIAEAHESLIAAGRWIEREALRRTAPVNIELADTFFRAEDETDDPIEVAYAAEGDDVAPMEANATVKALGAASRVAALLGFADIVDMIRRINPRVEADARVWLFHLRRSGRSLAIPASDGEIPGVGLAICYAREASFPEPLNGRGRVDPTTVAHELIHLFGGSDKYGVALRSFAPGLVSSRDVMRLNFDNLARMTIDPLTASEIGWPLASARDPRDEKTARDL